MKQARLQHSGQQVKSSWSCHIFPHCDKMSRSEDLSWSCLDAALKTRGEKKKLLPRIEKENKKKMSPIPLCGHWSAGSDSSSRIKSPRGPEPTCSPYLFVQTSTKDNRKRFEPGVPRGPNLASRFSPLSLLSSHFFRTPFFTSVCFSLALFLLFPLKSPSSSYTTL